MVCVCGGGGQVGTQGAGGGGVLSLEGTEGPQPQLPPHEVEVVAGEGGVVCLCRGRGCSGFSFGLLRFRFPEATVLLLVADSC